MIENPQIEPQITETVTEKPPVRTRWRLFRYITVKTVTLFITVAIGLYLTILIVNLGGYIDQIRLSDIDEGISGMLRSGWLREVTDMEERQKLIDQQAWEMAEAMGLHKPFLLRTVYSLWDTITLNLGYAYAYSWTNLYEGQVRDIVLGRLPFTLALIGLTNILVFISSVFIALFISRRYGGALDRFFNFISPIASMPNWVMGILLIVIFAKQLRILPFPKVISTDLADFNLRYTGIVLKQMILPALAIFVTAFFSSVYSWRTFFIIYSEEDYVQLGKAKGLPDRMLQQRYLLRPVLPYVVTSFVTLIILLWQGSIAIDLLFYWPGIGQLFINAVRGLNTRMTMGVVVIFAYMIALSVFVLDILYAILDPRIQVAGDSNNLRLARRRNWKRFFTAPFKRGARIPPTAVAPRVSNPAVVPISSVPLSSTSEDITPSPESAGTTPSAPGRASPRKTRHIRADSLTSALKELRHFPSAWIGLALIGIFIVLSIFTFVVYPYNKVIPLWRGASGDWYRTSWYKNAQLALPTWVNWFRKNDLPPTIIMKSQDGKTLKTTRKASEKMTEITIPFIFDFPYQEFPQDVVLFLKAEYAEKKPLIALTWITPDGREIDLGSFSITSNDNYYLTRDERLETKFKDRNITQALFAEQESWANRSSTSPPVALPGTYQLNVKAYVFDPEADVDAEMVVYGKVSGLAGTDNMRRDLTIGLLWGMPIALIFGLLGAIGTSLISMSIAAVGVWFGGWVDSLVQRLTEINMIMPVLPIAILVFYFYSKSIWTLLGVVVLLTIFGSAVKNYRSIFLQIKDAPYIEASKAYGASNWRIIRQYMVPQIIPVMIPQLVVMVPVFVYLEATFAFLGVSDPSLPTWGKLINEALTEVDMWLHPHWFLEPVALLIMMGVAFAFVGLALERILNPRLRRF
jgi:peptide/nickel transport system permease protein